MREETSTRITALLSILAIVLSLAALLAVAWMEGMPPREVASSILTKIPTLMFFTFKAALVMAGTLGVFVGAIGLIVSMVRWVER